MNDTPGMCRTMETRRCPPDACAGLPCARFEVTEEQAWKRWAPVFASEDARLAAEKAAESVREMELTIKINAALKEIEEQNNLPS